MGRELVPVAGGYGQSVPAIQSAGRTVMDRARQTTFRRQYGSYRLEKHINYEDTDFMHRKQLPQSDGARLPAIVRSDFAGLFRRNGACRKGKPAGGRGDGRSGDRH